VPVGCGFVLDHVPDGNEMTRRGIVKGSKVTKQKVARAKELRREMTPAEEVLWARLRTNQLGRFHFRRQQIIDGFLTDFYCHAVGVVLELDGLIHLRQAGYDRERDRVIAAHDLLVVRVPNDEILFHLDRLLQRIESFCHSRKSTTTTDSDD
jgi:very-short-patch-repair endonuclease